MTPSLIIDCEYARLIRALAEHNWFDTFSGIVQRNELTRCNWTDCAAISNAIISAKQFQLLRDFQRAEQQWDLMNLIIKLKSWRSWCATAIMSLPRLNHLLLRSQHCAYSSSRVFGKQWSNRLMLASTSLIILLHHSAIRPAILHKNRSHSPIHYIFNQIELFSYYLLLLFNIII